MPHEIVTALIVRSQRILLGHRSPARAYYPDGWDVFGGHVEPGEGHEQTLVRELQEELGITPTQWSYLEEISFPSEPPNPVTVYLYLVTGIYGDDSSQYEMVGGTRASERKPRTRKAVAA